MESNISHVCVLSRVSHAQLYVTPWTVAHLAPLSMVLQARIVEWIAILSSTGSSQHPGIEPRSPALQANSLLFELQGRRKY